MEQNSIIVAGGGLGGLGAALGLAKKGKKVVVLEKASELGEIGAGIQLGPNAFHSFDYLGVGKGAREQAVYIEKLRFMDAITAEEVAHVPLDENFRARFGNPYAVVHRADLHKEMVKACEDHDLIELRVNSEVVGYDQDGGSVTANLSSGDTVTGELLVGADGLHSAVRAKLVGDGAPRSSGHSTYRSVIPVEQFPEEIRWNAATLWMGPNCHLVHYPLSGSKVFNIVITKVNNATEVVAGKSLTHEEVHANFDHIHDLPQKLIEIGLNWKVWVLCDRAPTENWIDGRAVLLGDAAHPTLQYYAQGACMALEDAVCLSEVISSYPDNLDNALEIYRDNRVIRTARIQIGSRQLGDNWFHVDGVHRKLRNEIMGNMSAEDYYNQLGWLYGHKASDLAA
jgi:2-polyprenyl-6-methoxyphenol hydroxylase-like FAD-dependent oxidoreductase